MKDYHMNVFFSEEDDGYIADIPDLPHCAAFGETPEQALAEVLKASGGPMDREKIIDEVLKKRLVKKNTILVGLSNKKLFKKVGKNLYTLV